MASPILARVRANLERNEEFRTQFPRSDMLDSLLETPLAYIESYSPSTPVPARLRSGLTVSAHSAVDLALPDLIKKLHAIQKEYDSNPEIDRTEWTSWAPKFWYEQFLYDANCYQYAICRTVHSTHKIWPGEFAGMPVPTESEVTPENIKHRLYMDFEGRFNLPRGTNIRFLDTFTPPPKGWTWCEICLTSPNARIPDFHVLRCDRLCLWSGKGGATAPSPHDARKNFILNPMHADLRFSTFGMGHFDYTHAFFFHLRITDERRGHLLRERNFADKCYSQYANEAQTDYFLDSDYGIHEGSKVIPYKRL